MGDAPVQETASDPFEEGRTDPRHTLHDRLATAPLRYAEGALQNPSLDEGLVEVMLRNAGLSSELLGKVATDDRFRRSDRVKQGLVMHPATPPQISLSLVKFVPWRELLKVMDDSRLPHPVRAAAEQTVGDRLNQLPPMEQTRLARTAGRGIIPAFLRIRNPRVIHELLLNSKVVERDILALARDPNTPGEVLGSIARSNQWASRPPLRSALIGNFSTPIRDAIRLIPALTVNELRELTRNLKVRAPIRNEAEKQLRARQKR